MVQCQFKTKIQIFQSDWGGEYRPLAAYFQTIGVHFQHPCPHIHTQNGKAERKHQHIVDIGLTLLAQATLPLIFWWDAFETATYIINRLPSATLYHSSFTLLFKTQSQFNVFKVFGCTCFSYLKCYNNNKLAFRAHKCVFIGYSLSHKGYKCLSPTGRIYIADKISFNEQEFPYTFLFAQQSSSATSGLHPPSQIFSDPTFSIPHTTSPYDSPSTSSTLSPTTDSSTSTSSISPSPPPSHSLISSPITHNMSVLPSLNLHPMTTRSKVGISKPKVFSTITAPTLSTNPHTKQTTIASCP